MFYIKVNSISFAVCLISFLLNEGLCYYKQLRACHGSSDGPGDAQLLLYSTKRTSKFNKFPNCVQILVNKILKKTISL